MYKRQYGDYNLKVDEKYSVKGAYRTSFYLSRGYVGQGLLVRHLCSNTRCYRPEHLALGTKKDNVADCIQSGRYNKEIPDSTVASVLQDANTLTDRYLAYKYRLNIKDIEGITDRKKKDREAREVINESVSLESPARLGRPEHVHRVLHGKRQG